MAYDKKTEPLKITEKAYNKRNKKMRSEHKSETGKTKFFVIIGQRCR